MPRKWKVEEEEPGVPGAEVARPTSPTPEPAAAAQPAAARTSYPMAALARVSRVVGSTWSAKVRRHYLEKNLSPHILCTCGVRDSREKKVGQTKHKGGCVYQAAMDKLKAK
jgi:hypothetical protein